MRVGRKVNEADKVVILQPIIYDHRVHPPGTCWTISWRSHPAISIGRRNGQVLANPTNPGLLAIRKLASNQLDEITPVKSASVLPYDAQTVLLKNSTKSRPSFGSLYSLGLAS
jgi:hypothetical protein